MVWTVILCVRGPESPGKLLVRIVSAKSITPGETIDDVSEEEGNYCCSKESAQYRDPEFDFMLST